MSTFFVLCWSKCKESGWWLFWRWTNI